MDKMDKKKSSQTKRNKGESTDNKKKDVKKNQVKDKNQGKKDKPSDTEDNTNQGGNQYFCEDQKDSKNIICEKDLEHKSLDDDDEEGWCVQRNKKKNNHLSLSEEQKHHKNVQEKSKLSDSNSKQKKTHDNNNIDSHEDEDTHKLETKRRKRRRDKKKNSQEQNDISDIDSYIDDKLNQTKVHDVNNINVHEENTPLLSNDDLAGRRDKKKKKNSQEHNDISDIDSSIDDTFNQTKVHDGNNINLKEETQHLSVNNDSKGQRNKKKKKNSQEHKDISDIDSSIDDTFNQTKVHDGNNINLHEEETQHLSVNNDSKGQRNKNKNEKSQKQKQISDIDSIDDKLNQKKVYGGNNINLHEDKLHLSVNDDSKVRRDKKNNKNTSCQSLSVEKKSHKNVQKQNKWPEKDSIDDNMKQAHDKKKIDSHDTRKSEGAERPRDKYKNNNGQRQSRFSDACVLEEIDEDIFKLSKEYSLAHCVAEDLRMGAGIAVDFKNIFGGVGKLIDQKLKIGDVGIVKRHDQYAFYLVTKKTSNGKPTMITMEKALLSLLNKMKEYNLTKLGIPTIGCGLDRLDWSDTKSLINKIFSGSGIHITVCVPSKLLDSKKPPRLTVYITPKNLWEMETETTIILFIDLEEICNKNWTDHIVDKVDSKYPFKENLLKDVRKMKPNPGDIKIYNVKNEVIVCMFTTENTYYGSLENGFKTIDHTLKGYRYLAIQGGPIDGPKSQSSNDYPSDNFQRISWIVLIFRSVIHHSELWLCGNVTQNNNQVYYDEYCKSVLPMNNSFQYNSPTQKYNRYNDDRRSYFNAKETSNQH